MMSSLKFNNDEKEGSEDLMSAALYVEAADKDEDDDRPPQDGMAFLRQVIKERKRVPETTRVDFSEKKPKLASKPDDDDSVNSRVKAAPPAGCCPSAGWQRDQVSQFSDVRLKVSRHSELGRRTGELGSGVVKIPDKRNEAVWGHMILGGATWRHVCQAREEDDSVVDKVKVDVVGDQPQLQFITSLPVTVCEAVLEYIVSWLELTGWRPQYGAWLYSLLVRLEKPLTPDVGSLLRDLVLLCARERKKIAAASDNVDSDESIAALNLFICLVAKYFGQGDLEDREDE